MAETKETIVLEINATDALSQIAEMQKEMNALREAQKGFTTDSAEYQAIAGRIRIVTKDQADLKRALDASVKARREELDMVTFSNNSIKQNRELLKQLTAQYVEMKNPPKEVTAQIKSLSDALKVQEAAIGDTRRNVGNYTEAMSQALGGLSKLPGAAGQAAQGVQAMNAAFAAGTGPIGLILTAITALIPILQNNAEFADELGFAMDGLTKVFEVLVDFAVEGIKQLGFLKNAFSDPIGTIKQLGQMLADNLINRFKALGGFIEAISLAFQGKWSEATKAALNATTQLATGVEGLGNKVIDVYKSGDAASRQFDALSNALAKAKGQAQKYRAEADILERSLKNVSLTTQQRTEIANKAADALIKAANVSVEAAKLEQKALQEKLKGEKLNGEQEAQLTEAQTKVTLAAMEAKEAIAQRDTWVARLLAQNSKNVAAAEKEKMRTIKEAQDEFDLAVKQNAETQKKYSDLLLSIGKKNGDETKRQLEQSVDAFERDKNRRELTIQLIEEQNMTIAEINKEFAASDYKTFADYYKAKVDAAQKAADDEIAIEQAKFDAAAGIANALTELGNLVLGNSAAAVAFQKTMALINIGISTAEAIAGIVRIATTSPASVAGGVFSIVAQVATGIATVVANIAKATQIIAGIGEAQPPELQTFEDGGEVVTVGGKRHRDGGTKFVGSDGTRFEAEQGEKIFVMKRTAAANIGRLSAFNQLYGGNAWDNNMTRYAEDGGLVFDGGMTTRSMSQPDLAAQIQQAVANMPAPVVSVKEINTVNTRRTIAQEQAGL